MHVEAELLVEEHAEESGAADAVGGREQAMYGVVEDGEFDVVEKGLLVERVVGDGLQALGLRATVFTGDATGLRTDSAQIGDQRGRQDAAEDGVALGAVFLDMAVGEGEGHIAILAGR